MRDELIKLKCLLDRLEIKFNKWTLQELYELNQQIERQQKIKQDLQGAINLKNCECKDYINGKDATNHDHDIEMWKKNTIISTQKHIQRCDDEIKKLLDQYQKV